MINRWISMYSPQLASIINHTTNKYYSIFGSKADTYKFLLSIIPKSQLRRLHYIKKNKKAPGDNYDNVVEMLATNLELSKREINYYVNSNNINLKNYFSNTLLHRKYRHKISPILLTFS